MLIPLAVLVRARFSLGARLCRKVLQSFAIFLVVLLGTDDVYAEIAIPPELIEQLRSLTPSQQIALAERYDIDLTQILAFAEANNQPLARGQLAHSEIAQLEPRLESGSKSPPKPSAAPAP